MTFNEENLAGCARISLKLSIFFTKQIPLGCFGTSLDEDSKIESIDENKIIGKTDQNERNRQTYISSNKNDKISEIYTLRNQNERNRETYTSSNKNEIIWETDTSSNLIARTEEKNIGNKQGSLHKNEGKMELNGLSLMLLLLINQRNILIKPIEKISLYRNMFYIIIHNFFFQKFKKVLWKLSYKF